MTYRIRSFRSVPSLAHRRPPQSRSRWPRLTIGLALLAAASVPACRHALSAGGVERPSVPAVDVERLHVLSINGGGHKRQNYQSHLLHVKELRKLLLSAGVDADHMSIFSGDGDDPELDLAVREPQPEDSFWRLRGTPLARFLATPVEYANTTIEGTTLRAAEQEELRAWFESYGKKLKAGDTLLLYVTDHGEKNEEDLDNNTITLWGKKEDLSVDELRSFFVSSLDPEVRVVMLMSQCFSGAFSNLILTEQEDGIPTRNICGFFASTADRPAYGCYPENRGVENVGHSFRFLHGLSKTGNFAEAHERVLWTDATPDVPLRTSDRYLESLLIGEADHDDEHLRELIDSLLSEAWEEKERWEPEIRLLDRIGHAFGYFSPRSLKELQEQAERLPDISDQMRNVSKAWSGALGDSNRANVGRFLEASEDWTERLEPKKLKKLDEPTKRRLTEDLLADLVEFTRTRPEIEDRLTTIEENSRETKATSYRMTVRHAVVLRMRTILTRIAGQVFVGKPGQEKEKAAYENLVACENLRLPETRAGVDLAARDPFPPFEDDVAAATASLPAWIGIRFRDVDEGRRENLGLEAGATRVLTVYPGSPAEKAGVQSADIVLGPPGRPFDESRQVRSWAMLSEIGEPGDLEILRNGEPMRLSLVPDPFPMKFPELPGPPKEGEKAPPLKLSSYRGDIPGPVGEKPVLLFFWATWCFPCKMALPELLEFERETGIPVLAITDETKSKLDPFFEQMDLFPKNVAMDEFRQTFLAYGVSGTPTFVHVDADGTVKSYATGYAKEKGLQVAVWKERQQSEGVE